jgi:sugar (pentulose or hexulose) kinase
MGASTIRILLGELVDDIIKFKEIHHFKNEIKKINGKDKWDIEDIYAQIVFAINKALKQFPDIASIGVDSWGVDYMLLDQNGGLLEQPYAYRDTRTEGMQELWKQMMPAYETFERTGINFYIFNTLFQLLSAKNSPEMQKAESLLFTPAYITYRLTDKKFNELSIASTSQLLALNSNRFDKKILAKLNISPSLLGETIKAGTKIGSCKEKKLHDNKITAVAVCEHDTASAVAAIPATDNDFLYISTGTWCILGIESEKPLISPEALELGFTNERGYGDTYRTLKNIIGLWTVQGLQKAYPDNIAFSELEQKAKETEATNHIIDPDDKIFYNPDNMLDAFNRFFETTGQSKPETIGQYINCAYRSLSLAFNFYIKELETLTGKQYQNIHVIGGGSQSDILCQNIADYTGKNIYSGPIECATIGNIMVQGIGMGKIKNIAKGREIIKKSFPPKLFKPKTDTKASSEIYREFIKFKTIKNVEK